MHTVSVASAKSHLSSILAEVEAGEPVVITRHGRPVAQLSKVCSPKKPIDFSRIDAFRERLPMAKISSAKLIRQMRDAGY